MGKTDQWYIGSMSVRSANRYWLWLLTAVLLTADKVSVISKESALWSWITYFIPTRFVQCSSLQGSKWACRPQHACSMRLEAAVDMQYCHWDGVNLYMCCPQDEFQHSANIQNCGTLNSSYKSDYSAQRQHTFSAIVGGISLRTAMSSPWMVAIGEKLETGLIDWYCGGSLFQDNKVLTAAHCVVKRRADVVRVGELDFSTDSDKASPMDIAIKSVSVHPRYSPPAYYHDIAIIHLLRHANFGNYVKPICLAHDDTSTYEGAIAVLTGWGHDIFGGERSSILQEVSVTVFSNKDCNDSYSRSIIANRTYPVGIIREQLCAGSSRGGKDACQGDSGGPLVIRTQNMYVQIGVVSSGIGCGSKSYPGVYSRVSSYINWIRSQLH